MPLKDKYLHIFDFFCFGLVGQEYFSNDALLKSIMETFLGGGFCSKESHLT
jgi:hypothetical protein